MLSALVRMRHLSKQNRTLKLPGALRALGDRASPSSLRPASPTMREARSFKIGPGTYVVSHALLRC